MFFFLKKWVPQNRAVDSRFPIKIATSLRCSPLSDKSLYWQDCKDLRSWWKKNLSTANHLQTFDGKSDMFESTNPIWDCRSSPGTPWFFSLPNSPCSHGLFGDLPTLQGALRPTAMSATPKNLWEKYRIFVHVCWSLLIVICMCCYIFMFIQLCKVCKKMCM